MVEVVVAGTAFIDLNVINYYGDEVLEVFEVL